MSVSANFLGLRLDSPLVKIIHASESSSVWSRNWDRCEIEDFGLIQHRPQRIAVLGYTAAVEN